MARQAGDSIPTEVSSFADNYEMQASERSAVVESQIRLIELLKALDMDISASKSWFWSTSAEGRKYFRALGEIQGIMIVNTTTNTVVALSPERKMYIDVPNRRKTNQTETDVKPTGKKQAINGYDCEEWLVKSSEDGREVSYWVATKDFDFFLPMLKTLNRKDKMALYYMDLPNAAGSFPMKGTEVKSDGMELTRLEVDEVKSEVLSAELFEIPADYSKFERETSN